jgi:hypothetical protein
MAEENARATAERELAVIQELLQHPVLKPMLADLEAREKRCHSDVINYQLEGQHDILNHFSVIGEIRGLGALKLLIAERIADLQEQLEEADQPEQTN